MKRLLSFSFLIVLIAYASPCFPYSSNATHPLITFYTLGFYTDLVPDQQKYRNAFVSGSKDEDVPGIDEMFTLYCGNYGSDPDICRYVVNGTFTWSFNTYIDLIVRFPALWNAVNGMRYNNHFFNPDVPNDEEKGFQIGPFQYQNSRDFAIKSSNQQSWAEYIKSKFPNRSEEIEPFIDDFSWERAIELYEDSKGNDEEKIQSAYKALGHVAHLLQDMGSPPHVRNDIHPMSVWRVENLAEPNPFKRYFWEYDYEQYVTERNINRELWNSGNIIDAAEPGELFEGFAEYTKRNFFSTDKIDMDERWRYDHDLNWPYCITGEKDPDNNKKRYVFGKLWNETDSKLKDKIIRFARLGLFSRYTLDPEDRYVRYILDEAVHEDYWSILSPKTAQYTASLIALFRKKVPHFSLPTTETAEATSVTASTALLNGYVNPNSLSTAVWFEWGTDPNLTTSTSTPAQNIGTGTTSTPVNSALTGLNSGTTYYFRVAATNSAGTARGIIGSFIAGNSTTNGLVGYWSFNNCDARDDSGNGNNGIVYGVQCVDGKSGKAFIFDGIDDYIEVLPLGLNNGESFTVSYWLNFDWQPNRIWVMYFGYENYSNYGFHALINVNGYGLSNGDTQNGFFEDGSAQNTFNISAFQGNWVNVVTVYDAQNHTLKSFLNGSKIKENASLSQKYLREYPLVIGKPSPPYMGDSYFKGKLDELRIYNGALTDSEVKNLYTGNSNLPVDISDFTINTMCLPVTTDWNSWPTHFRTFNQVTYDYKVNTYYPDSYWIIFFNSEEGQLGGQNGYIWGPACSQNGCLLLMCPTKDTKFSECPVFTFSQDSSRYGTLGDIDRHISQNVYLNGNVIFEANFNNMCTVQPPPPQQPIITFGYPLDNFTVIKPSPPNYDGAHLVWDGQAVSFAFQVKNSSGMSGNTAYCDFFIDYQLYVTTASTPYGWGGEIGVSIAWYNPPVGTHSYYTTCHDVSAGTVSSSVIRTITIVDFE